MAPRPDLQRALRWGGFGTAYLACFFLTTALSAPLPWYLPLAHRWAWGTRVDGLAVDFYGRVLESAVAGALGYALAAWVARRQAAQALAAGATRVAVWCLGLLLFTAALYIYLLHGRRAPPAPLPPDYVAR